MSSNAKELKTFLNDIKDKYAKLNETNGELNDKLVYLKMSHSN
jgi:cell division septum initiation protein DivIVA